MIHIGKDLMLPEKEIEIEAVRAQGAGGQNVNKVASAVHLRFDILNSSLPDSVKLRLLQGGDSRISKDGILVIKAQEHRTRELNRQAAVLRLKRLIQAARSRPKPRIPTRPTAAASVRRLNAKTRRGQVKKLRRGVKEEY